ncbi:ABC transporter substrate-binding protein [Aeromicrobium choanae]|uniref:Peptide/nickel transport system substrate-binding protein n=1 Tax=Aeromicrobium choanae TaxID=1736691 RepID=A0A1T4YX86_9ACTN|nr:ABC transporter substrate-binding protein [Aeromicrobium choanae]SKB06394.1 peptide/nickel transport system substrate-binding protein [Aeromicrobium choanae]
MGIRSDIDTFDPHQTLGQFGAGQMVRLVYSTLVMRTSDGDLIPGVAEKWDVDPHGGDFTIQEGVLCSDGSELTASVIKKSFDRMLDPDSGAQYVERLFAGGDVEFTADDSTRTFSMKLENPNTDLLPALANVGQIICGAGVDNPEALASEPQGSGPFRLVSAKRGDSYEFERRDDYVSLPEGVEVTDLPKRLSLKYIADDSAMVNALLAGELTIGPVMGRDGERLETRDEFNHLPIESYGGDGLIFNQSPGLPGADPAFRKALAMAVDPQLYTRASTFDRSKPLRTLYTPNLDCYTEDNADLLPEVSVDAAAQALDAAGYPLKGDARVGPDGKPVTLRFVGDTLKNSGPQYITDQFEKLGIVVDLSMNDTATGIQKVFSNEFDLYIFPFAASLGTPTQHLGSVSEEGGVNVSHIDNAEYKKAAQVALSDPDRRCEAWQEGEAALLTNLDLLPLTWPVAHYFAKDVTFEGIYYSLDPFTIRSTK